MRVVSLVALAAVLAAGGERGVRVQYVGGTVSGLSSKGSARLDLTDSDTLLLRAEKTEVRIPYKRVNTLEYGQNVGRRYVAAIVISPILLLSKARRHFVTLGYVDTEDRQHAMVLRINKGDIRFVLASLEARTGRRVEFQDDEARKSGK